MAGCLIFRSVGAKTVKRKLLLIVLATFVGTASLVVAAVQDGWDIPEDAKAVESPFAADDEVIAEGATLYQRNCRMCHGESGKGDGPATARIKPVPPDITTAEAQDRMSDGEMFYKITVGKRPMREFESKLSEDERWNVVHFLRTLRAG
ncbi:MAG: hypothetical protein CL479_01670 [Acidobacteria bacterium]|nr:hypothetical protein [Acidobacteriota bacterium]